MTPELKHACELVFQEHKATSFPITWNRDAFRGRLSTGLTEMAKDTLIRKHIILYPNPNKRINTVLNPAIASADSYEEAEGVILSGLPMISASRVTQRSLVPETMTPVMSRPARAVTHHRLVTVSGETKTVSTDEIRWYMKPVFYYVVWPVLAAAFGGLLAYLMGMLYTELAFNLK